LDKKQSPIIPALTSPHPLRNSLSTHMMKMIKIKNSKRQIKSYFATPTRSDVLMARNERIP
jgi:hypothetical protein